MKNPSYQILMEYALRALSRRAHTIHEMREKLKKRPHHAKELEDQVVDRLIELNLLNDEAYIKRYIESATTLRLQGHFKVKQKLFIKGIPFEMTQQIWKEMKIPELEVAKKALKKVEKRFQKEPAAKRFNKRARFLASRGFSPDIVLDLAKLDEIT